MDLFSQQPKVTQGDVHIVQAIKELHHSVQDRSDKSDALLHQLLQFTMQAKAHTENITLGTNRYTYEANGYRFNGLYAATSFLITVSYRNATHTINIYPGYNQVNLPDGANVTASSDVTVTLIRDQHLYNPIQIQGTSVILLDGVSNTGAGNDVSIGGNKTLSVEVFGTAASYQLQIEGKSTSGTPYVLTATNLLDLSTTQTISSAGLYQFDVTGLLSVDANVVSVTGGNVTVQGRMVSV